MSLLTSYSADNRVIDSGKTVYYNLRRIYGEWTHTVGAGQDHYYDAYEATRVCRKQYRYVGMTYAAAQTCATAMITKYTRTQKDSEWDYNDNAEFGENPTGSSVVMADISVQHVAGGMYETVISVNETDTRLRRAHPGSVASLFSSENARDYDE